MHTIRSCQSCYVICCHVLREDSVSFGWQRIILPRASAGLSRWHFSLISFYGNNFWLSSVDILIRNGIGRVRKGFLSAVRVVESAARGKNTRRYTFIPSIKICRYAVRRGGIILVGIRIRRQKVSIAELGVPPKKRWN